ncbi:MAG: molecular chaperone HtpG [Desulfovibrio sp.]|jgi:molecular chaperone HtpG|nr:molecular chaperone HtpG [Desulfovibrio sp.]
MAKAKTHTFQAETQKVLNILTHSLYTNREIFLRELLSNASDALEKLRFLQSRGEAIRDSGLPLEIRISVRKEEGIVQIADTGLGMTGQELIDNLGTIAKSGSEEFMKAAGGSDAGKEAAPESEAAAGESEGEAAGAQAAGSSTADIIGRFGIGFYSVFMVADLVEVISVPVTEGAPAHIWRSEGSGGFSVSVLEGEDAASCRRGTIIRATMKEDAKEFLEKSRLQSVIRLHSNFLPFPVFLEDERINTTPALWREPKFSVTQERYTDFYQYLTYDDSPPLDVIHLSVDAPVQFNALMFIPASAQDYAGMQRDAWGLDLYARRVLIERGNKELAPQYLAFLKGVVDTEDLPLNISRETLQENVLVRKISQTIVKQALHHLEKLAASDSGKYETFWNLHGKLFKFAFSDYARHDRVAPLLRFSSSASDAGGLISLDTYLERCKPGQKEIWHLAAPSLEAARINPHMERFRRKGIEVLYLLDPVDELALEAIGSYREHRFKSVEQADGKALEGFADVCEAAESAAAMNDDEKAALETFLEKIREILGNRIKEVRLSDRLADSVAVLVSPDGVSSSMEKLMRVMQHKEEIPLKILEMNPDHPFMRALLRMYIHTPDNPLLAELLLGMFDNVQLLDGYLAEPYGMADRNLKFMSKALGWYADLARA